VSEDSELRLTRLEAVSLLAPGVISLCIFLAGTFIFRLPGPRWAAVAVSYALICYFVLWRGLRRRQSRRLYLTEKKIGLSGVIQAIRLSLGITSIGLGSVLLLMNRRGGLALLLCGAFWLVIWQIRQHLTSILRRRA